MGTQLSDHAGGGTVCPPQSELREFWSGRLDDAGIDRIADHLQTCDRCSDSFTDIVNDDDTIDSCFRGPEAATKIGRTKQILASEDQADQQKESSPVSSLGQFDLISELGRGGMGIVYKAIDRGLDCPVALKVIHDRHATSGSSVQRFRREQKLLGRLNHPNIVRARTAGEHSGRHFLVMDFVEGVNLSNLQCSNQRLSISTVCEIIRQTAVGLQYIHEHDQIHRDLKPSNLMVDTQGTVRILDLGLSRFSETDLREGDITHSECVVGTPDFMAPEQTLTPAKTDIRADIYSLGCTMYSLLTGHVMYRGKKFASSHSRMLAHATEPIPDLQNERTDVPEPLLNAWRQMVAKARDERFELPSEVAQAVLPYCDGADLASLVENTQDTEQIQNASYLDTDSKLISTGQFEQPSRGAEPKKTSRLPVRAVVIGLLIALGIYPAVSLSRNLLLKSEIDPVKYQALRWYDLLEQQPKVIAFPKSDQARWWCDTKRRDLTVDNSGVALLAVGSTKANNYDFRLRIQRNAWHGRVGLIFGYQPDPENGPDAFRYQTIVINSFVNDDGKHRKVLTREIHNARFHEGRIYLDTTPLANAVDLQDLSREEVQLEISVRGNRLFTARIDGAVLPITDTRRGKRDASIQDCRGDFGVIVIDGASNFRSAEVQFLSDQL